MKRFSVPGYNIYDFNGNILYDGEIVRKDWGGGNDGRPYRVYAYHRLCISPQGKLSLVGHDNIISSGEELFWTDTLLNPTYLEYGPNKPFKVYI